MKRIKRLGSLLGLLGCTTAVSSVEAKPVQTASVNTAMHQFVRSIVGHNSTLFLTFVSHSQGLKIINTLDATKPSVDRIDTFATLQKDFRHKGDLYQEYFRTNKADASFYDEVKAVKAGRWKKIAPNTFEPALKPPFYSRNQLFVKWKKENGKWIIEEIGCPIS